MPKRHDSEGAGAWPGLATGFLTSELVKLVLEFVDSGFQLLRCSLVCKSWQLAVDEVGMRNVWAVVSKRAQRLRSKMKVDAVVQRFGPSLRRLDLSRVNVARRLQQVVLEAAPGLRELRLMSFPGQSTGMATELLARLRGVEVIDAGGCSLVETGGPFHELEYARLWQAESLKDRAAARCVGQRLQQLKLSDAKLVGSSTLDAIAARSPPLVELVLRTLGSLDCRRLGAAIEAVESTLTLLDLTGSLADDRDQFVAHFKSPPGLRYLILDSNRLLQGQLRLERSPDLEVLSLAWCSGVTDDFFAHVPELAQLRVARLSATRIGAATVDVMRAQPGMRLLLVDSCRDVPRDMRLAVARAHHGVDIAHEAPRLLFSSWLTVDERM